VANVDDDSDVRDGAQPGPPGRSETEIDQTQVFRFVLDDAPGLVAYWNTDLVCVFANQAYAVWFGRPVSEIIGVRYETLLGALVTRRNRPFIDAALSGKPQRFEQALTRADGEWVPILSSLVPHVVEGRTVGFICHCTDVTLLKDTERALREEAAERQRANQIIRASVDALEEAQHLGQIGSWTWSAEPDEVRWSKELYRIMGRDPALLAPTFAEHDAI
jgi:PAS domain S-box-containing protein